MSACCKALALVSTKPLILEDLLAIYGQNKGPLPPSLLAACFGLSGNSSSFAVNAVEVFGNVPTVISSPNLTAQFLQLPHAAILALLSSDVLTTDREDSVLMLLSWWLEEHKGGEGTDDICSAHQVS